MSAFEAIARGLAYGVISTLWEDAKAQRAGTGHGGIESLCQQLGWSVDERSGNTVRLHFNDTACGVRKLSIWHEQGGVVAFLVTSLAVLDAVPQPVTEYLLKRNTHLGIGSWMGEGVDGRVVLGLLHRERLAGFSAASFHRVCEVLVTEVQDFDDKLRAAGYLGGRT